MSDNFNAEQRMLNLEFNLPGRSIPEIKRTLLSFVQLVICLGVFCTVHTSSYSMLYAGDRSMDSTKTEAQQTETVLVRFKQDVTVEGAEKTAHSLGLEVVEAYPPMAVTRGRVLLVVRSQDLAADDMIKLLQEQFEVDYAEIHVIRSIRSK